MSFEIQRKFEQWLCDEMMAANPGVNAVPSKTDAESEPPFYFVKVTDCMDITPPGAERPTYQITAKVALVNHISNATAKSHSTAVRRIRTTLSALRRGYYAPQELVFSGMDFTGTESISDNEAQARADLVTLVAGVSG